MYSVGISTLTTAHQVRLSLLHFSHFINFLLLKRLEPFKWFSSSVDDIKEQNHRIFEEYRDPCRAGPGREKPWVIGVQFLPSSLLIMHTI